MQLLGGRRRQRSLRARSGTSPLALAGRFFVRIDGTGRAVWTDTRAVCPAQHGV